MGERPDDSPNRREFPGIKDELGEDPARWLDREMTDEHARIVVAMIRGMRSLRRLKAWRSVEIALDRGEGGGPREDVLALLDERKLYLEQEAGESVFAPEPTQALAADGGVDT